jgi:hypothetical protein
MVATATEIDDAKLRRPDHSREELHDLLADSDSCRT